MNQLLHLRAVASQLQQAALEAVDPAEAVYQAITRVGDQILIDEHAYPLPDFDQVFIISVGKAAVPMADAVAEVLRDQLSRGIVITKYRHIDRSLANSIRVYEASHPVPDENSVNATRDLVDLLRQATPRDLIVCTISGGGSALMTLPAEGLTLLDLQATTQLLLRAGAAIHQINAIRKHLDSIKGGGLARLANGATIVSLVLSDVIGDDLSVIASGPTSPDPSTFAEAWQAITQFDLIEQLPAAVRTRLELGRAGQLPETPKPGDTLFERVRNIIVGSNTLAAQAAEAVAKKLHFNTLLLSTYIQGEAREVAQVAAAIAREIVQFDRPLQRPACVIWGGETTVTLKGHGLGGRNQELALAAAIAIDGLPNTLIVALGTDGTDGPTDAAGAIASGDTLARARKMSLDARAYLADNDAYHFFQPLGDLIMTGPTGTNVNDLLFLLAD